MIGCGRLVFPDKNKRELFRKDTRISNIISSLYDFGDKFILYQHLAYDKEKLAEKVAQDYEGKLFRY